MSAPLPILFGPNSESITKIDSTEEVFPITVIENFIEITKVAAIVSTHISISAQEELIFINIPIQESESE